MKYVCLDGCCVVSVTKPQKRGQRSIVTVNGERGTFPGWALEFGKTTRQIECRVDRRLCLRADEFERQKQRANRLARETHDLANRFLRMPRVSA